MRLEGKREVLLSAVATTGASRHVKVDTVYKSLFVRGITTATVHFEGSDDGTTWLSMGSVTADGIITVQNSVAFVRANVTTYTSGTITASLLT